MTVVVWYCKSCDAKYGHRTDNETVMDLVNHQLWAHQKLLKPSVAITEFKPMEMEKHD